MMSLKQVCRTFHRHVLPEYQIPSNPQHQNSCYPYQSSNLICNRSEFRNNSNCSNHNSSKNNAMNILGMTDYYNTNKSPLIESLKRKSSAATLLSPLSLSTGISGTTLSSSSLSSLSSTVTRTQSIRSIPYYVSCFSPCDLPIEIFIYLLEFLSPGDLWKLSQVSRSMQLQVATCMSRIQRFKYGAVRILHQEHAEAVPDPSPPREHTIYEHTTFGASLSSFSLSSTTSSSSSSSSSSTASSVRLPVLSRRKSAQVQSRSAYWTAQAEYLVSTIVEGTSHEPRPDISIVKGKGLSSSKLGLETRGNRSSDTEEAPLSYEIPPPSHEDQTLMLAGHSSIAPASSREPTSSPAPSFVSVTTCARLSTLAPFSVTNMQGESKARSRTEEQAVSPFPMERFEAAVDLLFDPNIVQLGHRRAIINCARYVSASIEESFKKTVKAQDPSNIIFHTKFRDLFTINTGPYLTVFSPVLDDDDEADEGPGPTAIILPPVGGVPSKIVTPPTRLGNYFQIMLWHRCMSDLISLYNRIQKRHMDNVHSSNECHRTQNKVSCVQNNASICHRHPLVSIQQESITPSSEDYPFCCNAHSLVFTTQYPFSFVPYTVRIHFRRILQKVQSLSHRNIFLTTINSPQGENAISRRKVQYTGPSSKLMFCKGSLRCMNTTAMSSSSLREGAAHDEDEALVSRRYRIEEQIRQDSLDKQELLALCHMACGLFLTEDHRSPNAPTTIMTLLRQGSPWNKGVWQEGEWRHAAIDLCQKDYDQAASTFTVRSLAVEATEKDQGRWQRICLATIEFLAHENLAWGGNRTNAELSRLRATSNTNAWIYYD